MKKSYVMGVICLMTGLLYAQDKNGTFSVHDGIKCTQTQRTSNKVTIEIEGTVRVIRSNAIPNHKTGPFPNPGNPNSIQAQNKTYRIPMQPKKAASLTSVSADGFGKGFPAYEFGVALNGIKLEPTAAEFFGGRSANTNTDWALEALSTQVNLGDDCNNAHVQPTGEYHYHGTPHELVKKASGVSMFQVGWAADGFPIYYKYGYRDANDVNSPIQSLTSSYRLKKGKRPGDGVTAPNGSYDGTYVRDFEFVEGLGDLDEANGRFGKTPEFPEGTYYYVITDDFPSLPRYFVGTPSKDFAVGGGMFNGESRKRGAQRFGQQQGRPQGAPNFKELLKRMDLNDDHKISLEEAKGPLQRDFKKMDINNDGYITEEEFNKAPKPNRSRRNDK